MNNISFFLSLLLTSLILVSCQQNQNKSTSSEPASESVSKINTKPASQENAVQVMNPDYSHIPMAEKGITVVLPEGWEENTMEFHIGYCGQMLASLADTYDPAIFCPCFLDKIQYYYEAIYFKEAYQDQEKWNQECLEKAKLEE